MKRLYAIAIAVMLMGVMVAGQTAPPPPPAAPARPPRVRQHLTTSAEAGRGQAYLGVDIDDVTPERATALKLKATRGAEITMVDQDAPAGKAGLKEHDVVLSANGKEIVNAAQFRDLIRGTPPGTVVALGISRDGQPMTMNVKLGSRQRVYSRNQHIVIPPLDIRIPEIDIPSFTMLQYSRRNGLVVENLTAQLGDFFGVKDGEGVLVRSVEKGSQGEAAGFHAGDVIVRVGNERVTGTSDWTRLMREHASGSVPVTVVRDRHEQNLTLNIPEHSSDQSDLRFELPDISASLAELQPELEKTQRAMSDRIQRELQQHQKEWQKNAEQAQRQAEKEMRRAQRELEKAMQDLQHQMEEQ